MRSKQINYFD